MAIQSTPLYLQSGSHPAEDDRRAHHAIFGLRGGIVAAGDLAVAQNGTPNMTVLVATGQVAIPGSEATYQGVYLAENRGSMSVTIAASDATNPRIDLVVARVRDAAYSGATNTFAIEAVTGTPAASPAVPATPANSWVLAQVAVAALATTVVTANITDRRANGTGQTGQAAALGATITCTSTTRPAVPFEGMRIYQTDTDEEAIYSGAAWVTVARLGAWTDYTPAVTQSGGISKTVTYCRYQKIGRTVMGNMLLQLTSGGLLNTVITVTAPPFTAAAAGNMAVGAGYFLNAAANPQAAGHWGITPVLSTTTVFSFISATAAGLSYFGTASAAFGEAIQSGDSISFSYRYETTA